MTEYIGTELELFAAARNWKDYLYREIRPYLGRRVVEVGAGIGTTTQSLCRAPADEWLCVEPDPAQSVKVARLVREGNLPSTCVALTGDIQAVRATYQSTADTVLYIDVLEHIERDREELAAAAEILRVGGRLVVLAPAHQWLYTAFDKAVGHYRRYDKRALTAVFPNNGRMIASRYLDSCGLLASAGNAFLLRSSIPKPSQIKLWDSVLVPMSRRLDPLIRNRLGKSVLCVWEKDDHESATPALAPS